MQPVRVIFSGATGAVGRSLIPAILASPEFRLTGAVAGRSIGSDVGAVIGLSEEVGVQVSGSFADAFANGGADVLLDFSTSEAAAINGTAALEAGVAVVLGTTAVAEEAIEAMSRIADERHIGLFLAPNLTFVGQVLFRCAALAGQYFGDVEIVEYHNSAKRDAPSGTARETAQRIADVASPAPTPDSTARGLPGARGAVAGKTRIHSVRLPSFYSRHEVLFAAPGEMLTILADQFSTDALIGPTLRAARLILDAHGVVRELPGLFDPPDPKQPREAGSEEVAAAGA